VLKDAAFLSVADRSILSCWGLAGGLAGKPFRVTVSPGGADERVLPGLVDDEPLPTGTLVRIDTTGGGGWGDPLERETSLVALDVLQGKVSAASAREDYGVVLVTAGGSASTYVASDVSAGATVSPDVSIDEAATARLRDELRASRGVVPFFDRGPGYRQLSGREYAEVDLL
jgi:N-methylhydantoinase B